MASIVQELGGEKIDIVRYSEVPEEFIAAALAPAEVMSVVLLDEGQELPGDGAGRPALAGDRQGRPERKAGRQADRI